MALISDYQKLRVLRHSQGYFGYQSSRHRFLYLIKNIGFYKKKYFHMSPYEVIQDIMYYALESRTRAISGPKFIKLF